MLFVEFVRFLGFLMLAGLVKLALVRWQPDSRLTSAVKALY